MVLEVEKMAKTPAHQDNRSWVCCEVTCSARCNSETLTRPGYCVIDGEPAIWLEVSEIDELED